MGTNKGMVIIIRKEKDWNGVDSADVILFTF